MLLQSILAGLDGIDPSLPADELWRAAVKANVRWSMRQLAETPAGRLALAERCALPVGAVYELRTARLRFLAREGDA